jgi:hypothetical protein
MAGGALGAGGPTLASALVGASPGPTIGRNKIGKEQPAAVKTPDQGGQKRNTSPTPSGTEQAADAKAVRALPAILRPRIPPLPLLGGSRRQEGC